MKKAKIILTPSVNAIKLLAYIDKNIISINKSGYVISIEKILKSEMQDDEVIETLRQEGITRLPAMKISNNKTFIGNKAIIAELSKRVKTMATQSKTTAPGDISSYWDREMYSSDGGKRTPRTDAEEDANERGDIERKMAGRTIPTGDRPLNGSQHNGQHNGQNNGQNNGQHNTQHMSDDNITKYQPDGNDPDDIMMAAWLENH